MSYNPQAKEVKLTKEQATKIASDLCDQIDSSITGKSKVKDRWDMVEDMFRCDQRTSTLRIAEGLDPYFFPMYRQKATKIARTVQSAYFGLKPWVQMIDVTKVPDQAPTQPGEPPAPAPQPVPDVERTYQAWLEMSNLKNVMSTVFLNMVHFNCGLVQVCTRDDGSLFARCIHPEKSVMYPCQTADYKSLMTMGHMFTKLKYEIEEGLDAGAYNKNWLDIDKVGMAPNEDTETTRDTTMAKDTPVSAKGDDEAVLCYELVTKLKLSGDNKRKLYLAMVEKEGRQLMSLEEYPYSRPWYFNCKTDYSEDNMYPSDSIGGVMQGLQFAYNDGNTVMLQGSLMAAFPLTVISGGSLSNKVASYQAGQLIESNEEIKMQSVGTQFNPGALMPMMQKIEELADGVSGVSRLGTTEALPGHTTATAAHGFLAAQQESKDEYVEGVSAPFKDMAEFIFEMMIEHDMKVALYMGRKWQISPNANIDRTGIDLQPTGGGTTTDPQLLGQKLMTLQQMSQDPNSGLDPQKVSQKLIESMDFPFDTDSLMAPPPDPDQPPPPIMQPTLSISLKFEDLANPDLTPAQLDVLEQAGIHVPQPPQPPDEMNQNGQPDVGQLLQQLGMGAGIAPPGGEGAGNQPPIGGVPNGGQVQ